MRTIITKNYKYATESQTADYNTWPGGVSVHPSNEIHSLPAIMTQDEEESPSDIKKRWKKPIRVKTKRIYQTGRDVPDIRSADPQ